MVEKGDSQADGQLLPFHRTYGLLRRVMIIKESHAPEDGMAPAPTE